MPKVLCQTVLELLPHSCPVKAACTPSIKEVCEARNKDIVHDLPCHGGPCSGHCQTALDGGKVEVIKKTKRKKKL